MIRCLKKYLKPREIRLDRDYKYYDYYVSYFNGQYGKVMCMILIMLQKKIF